MSYTKVGPFTDNSTTPPVSASFLNGVENWLAGTISDTNVSSSSGIITAVGLVLGSSLLKLNTHSTVKNGSTSGTMTVFEFFASGSALKFVIVYYNNYKNTAASANTVSLQAPFTGLAYVWSGNCQGTNLTSSGAAVNINCVTGLGSTSDGTATTTSKLNAYSQGQVSGSFDSIKEPGSNSATRTGSIYIFGY